MPDAIAADACPSPAFVAGHEVHDVAVDFLAIVTGAVAAILKGLISGQVLG